MTSLTGRTAIVTGSTSGIGVAIARTLAAEGAHVVVHGRDTARGDVVVKEIRAAGGRADVVAADLGGTCAQLRTFAAEATTALGGRVDILVNNAGVYPARTSRTACATWCPTTPRWCTAAPWTSTAGSRPPAWAESRSPAG